MTGGAQGEGAKPMKLESTLLVLIGAFVSFLLVVGVGLTILAAGLTEASPGARSASSGEVSGQAVYAQNCASCHGTAGEGKIGPQLAGLVAEKYPDVNTQILIVEEGRAAMPAFRTRLSAEEIGAVVQFERQELGTG